MTATMPPPRLGETIFRWRSYLPLVAVGGLAVGATRVAVPSATVRVAVASGLALALVGLALRVWAVGQAPPGTSGRHRRQHAASLNTFGVYSVVRHPLYLGNVLIWSGASMTSGWLVGALGSALLGGAMFALIVRHEDAYLRRAFGASHAEWSAATPAFLPRPALWRPSRRPFHWRRAVVSEYSTLHSIGLLALVFAALRGWGSLPPRAPGALWWGLLAANSALYLALRAWRKGLARPARSQPAEGATGL